MNFLNYNRAFITIFLTTLVLFLSNGILASSFEPIFLKARTVVSSREKSFSAKEYLKYKRDSSLQLMLDLGFNEQVALERVNSFLQEKHHHVLVMVQLDSLGAKYTVEEAWGLDLGNSYVGSNTFVTRVSLAKLQQYHHVKGVAWIGHFDATLKSTLKYDSLQFKHTNHGVEFVVALTGDNLIEHGAVAAHVNNLMQQGSRKAEFVVESLKRASLKCFGLDCRYALTAVAQQENVMWIQIKFPKTIMNSFGHSILQHGPNARADDTTIWNHGIRGEGEIVTVMDTGLDWDNCFFADSNHSEPPMMKVDLTHRKVVGYYRLSQNVLHSDGIYGHGTHVAGTVAGSIQPSEANYEELHVFNGAAPNAKLIIQAAENSEGGLSIPIDLYQSVKDIESQGSYIHTNSWGSDLSFLVQCSFDCNCVWGILAERFGLQPGAPAEDKWCEANLNAPCCYLGSLYDIASNNIDDILYELDTTVMLFAAGNSGAMSSRSSITYQASSKNAIVVGSSNTAYEHFQVAHKYADLGYIAEYFEYENVEECCQKGQSLCCENFWKSRFNNENRYNTHSVTGFSSRGPTLDGRIRPDVVAPGHIVYSAYSDGDPTSKQCGTMRPNYGNGAAVVEMSGTSMATPGVAGAAALVREYFKKGFYPLGKANSTNAMTPSGMLVKAILVHSGTPLSRTINGNSQSENVPSGPNRFSGHGLVTLDKVLAFADSDFHLVAVDGRALDNGQTDSWKVTAQGTGVIQATLTWYDPPANPAASQLVLNQLDLSLGDEVNSEADVTKRLSMSVREGDVVDVKVVGASVSVGPQKYALVVTFDQGTIDGPVHRSTASVRGISNLVATLAIVLALVFI